MTRKWSRETLATVTWWNSEERRLAVEAAKLEANARLRPWYWPCFAIVFAGALFWPNFHGWTRAAVVAAAVIAGFTIFAKMFLEMRRFMRRLSEIDAEGIKRPRHW